MSLFFPSKQHLPPKYFNDLPYNKYLEEISLYYNHEQKKNYIFSSNLLSSSQSQSSSIIYSDKLVSHPQLPVYLSTNSNGVIFLYSFCDNNKISKVIDEFYVDTIDSNSNYYINKIKFNLYGDNFMACDNQGKLYTWNFDHIQSRKIPQNIINNNNNNVNNKKIVFNDMYYLNNTGLIATLTNNNIIIYDLLMPEKKRKVNEITSGGGDILLPYLSNNCFIVANNDSPGKISFIDIRKMEKIKSISLYDINNYNNNDMSKINNAIKIMDIKLSENEKYLITYESDYIVKIWDLANKYNPLLVESLKPFKADNKDYQLNNYNNFRGKIELSLGFLFVSKNNNIKLLRNNII